MAKFHTQQEIKHIKKNGTKFINYYMGIYIIPSDLNKKYIIIGKKIEKKAHDRNLIRRRITHILSSITGHQIVVCLFKKNNFSFIWLKKNITTNLHLIKNSLKN